MKLSDSFKKSLGFKDFKPLDLENCLKFSSPLLFTSPCLVGVSKKPKSHDNKGEENKANLENK